MNILVLILTIIIIIQAIVINELIKRYRSIIKYLHFIDAIRK